MCYIIPGKHAGKNTGKHAGKHAGKNAGKMRGKMQAKNVRLLQCKNACKMRTFFPDFPAPLHFSPHLFCISPQVFAQVFVQVFAHVFAHLCDTTGMM